MREYCSPVSSVALGCDAEIRYDTLRHDNCSEMLFISLTTHMILSTHAMKKFNSKTKWRDDHRCYHFKLLLQQKVNKSKENYP